MSDSVVIKKITQEAICQILDRLGWKEEAEALRAAPDTLSLEGVRQWTPYEIAIAKGDQILQNRHRFYLDDDLRRLVTPVQPSAVVSREALLLSRIYRMVSEVVANPADNDMETFVAIMTEIEALHQSVAPVQSGSVEDAYVLAIVAYAEYITLLESELTEIVPFMANHHWKSSRFEAGQLARKKIDDALTAIRTTTQSAPSVGGVDSHRWNIEETDRGIRLCRGNHERSDGCEWEEFVRESYLTTNQSCPVGDSSPPEPLMPGPYSGGSEQSSPSVPSREFLATWIRRTIVPGTGNLFGQDAGDSLPEAIADCLIQALTTERQGAKPDQSESIRHAYNAGVAWAMKSETSMTIDEYLKAQGDKL